MHVEVAGMQPGPPRRVTLHPAKAKPGQIAAEAWVDDDLGIPVPGAQVQLDGSGRSITLESDRFGTARLEVPRAQTRHFRFSARLPSLPGLAASLDELVIGGVTHAVSSVAGHGVELEREPPAESVGEGELPLIASAPIDLKLFVEPEAHGARVRVRLIDSAGKPAAGQLMYQASAGKLELGR
jgi:hypothetical protein